MGIGVCPVRCEPCTESECYVAGCRLHGGPLLESCEDCGELHVVFVEPPTCFACWIKIEPRVKNKR